jgi:hypothetical protein
MVLNEESGVDGKNLAINVELNAVAGPHVAFACQVCYKLILEPANGDEGCRIIRNKVRPINRPFKHSSLLSNRVLRVGHN